MGQTSTPGYGVARFRAIVFGAVAFGIAGCLHQSDVTIANSGTKSFQEAITTIEAAVREAADSGDPPEVDAATCKALLGHITPRVHSIGLSKILTFEPPTSEQISKNDLGLEIPIEGRDLNYPGCLEIGFKVVGTINAEKNEDAALSRADVGSGALTIQLGDAYLGKLKTGDHLDVFITVNTLPKLQPENECRTVTYAHRRFTVYSVEDYRALVQSARVPAKDIQAFPLPPDEAEILFGPVVSKNFYAVRLSVRNTTGEDKLISTGMITASGRLLVVPETKNACEKVAPPAFTIPVEIAPQSLEQIYAMVDDEETDQLRSTVFRSLEFVGALAAATTGAYSDSNDLLTGVGLFTGVFIPELDRLWTDRWPGYERNVVNFSMPDLFKVPKGAVAGHKYVFFSKNKLEGIIADQQYFDVSFRDNLKAPYAAVAQVRFDSLDIPFENVFAVAAVSFERQAANLKSDLPRVIDQIARIERHWEVNDGSFLFGRLTKKQLDDAETILNTALAAASGYARGSFDTNKAAAVSASDVLLKSVAAANMMIDAALKKSESTELKKADLTPVKDELALWLSSGAKSIDQASTAIKALEDLGDEVYSPQAKLLNNRNQSLGERKKALSAIEPSVTAAESAATFSSAEAVSVLKTLKAQVVLLEKAATDARTQSETTAFVGDMLAGQIRVLLATESSLRRASMSVALLNNPAHGLTALQDYERDLNDLFTDISAGRDIAGHREKVAAIEAELASARKKISFYTDAADVFKGGDKAIVIKMLDDIATTLADDDKRNTLLGNLDARAIQILLNSHNGLSIVPELTPAPSS